MRFRSLLLLRVAVSFGVLALAAPSVLAQPRTDMHVVQAGETLFRIASANQMTVAELKALNDLQSDHIVVGQRLRLTTLVPIPPRPVVNPDGTPAVGSVIAGSPNDPPSTTPPAPVESRPPPSGAGPVHVVQPGETLFRIAVTYDTSVEALRRANGIQGDQIAVGQRLRIPGPGSATPSPTVAPIPRPSRMWRIDATTVPADLVHFVEPGETLYTIAASLGVRSDELLALNDVPPGPLVPGSMILLPRPVDPRLAIEARAFAEPDTVGLALVYPQVMVGRRMASGATYDPAALTASHRSLPFGTVILVTNPASGRSTFVRVMDRGPVSHSYLMELSAAAAEVLELDPNAARRVELRRLP